MHAGDSPLLLLQQNGFSTVKNHNHSHHFSDSPVDFNQNWRNGRDRGDDQSKDCRRECKKEEIFQRLMMRILNLDIFLKEISEDMSLGELNLSTSCQPQEETADEGSDSKEI